VPDGRPIAVEQLAAGQPVQPKKAVAPSLAELESQAIERALERTAGNLSAAARLLGIDRTTLWRKLKKGG
jgi:transcriptional regulator of acetoin/glycerol metabolism